MRVESVPGSRELPIVVKAGEVAYLGYHFWRGEGFVIFFRICQKNGKLSPLVELADPGFNRLEEITSVCGQCGERVKAAVFFF